MNKNVLLAVAILAVVGLIAGGYFLLTRGSSTPANLIDESLSQNESTPPITANDSSSSSASFSETTPSAGTNTATGSSEIEPGKLNAFRLRDGTGSGAKSGDNLTVHYVGALENGQKFDSSRDRGQPFTLTLGAGQVIKGWDQGLVGMKVGEIRKLIIPPSLAYGETGTPGGPIPPNATITFEIELLKIN